MKMPRLIGSLLSGLASTAISEGWVRMPRRWLALACRGVSLSSWPAGPAGSPYTRPISPSACTLGSPSRASIVGRVRYSSAMPASADARSFSASAGVNSGASRLMSASSSSFRKCAQ